LAYPCSENSLSAASSSRVRVWLVSGLAGGGAMVLIAAHYTTVNQTFVLF
jgi:hypothetical protein